MMLENQVCTRQQAKRLRELGVFQLSICVWYEDSTVGASLQFNVDCLRDPKGYAAFSVAELGVMLPVDEDNCGVSYTIGDYGKNESGQYQNGFSCKIFQDECMDETEVVYSTEAEARAAMLIYLLEHNFITRDEVNRRLAA